MYHFNQASNKTYVENFVNILNNNVNLSYATSQRVYWHIMLHLEKRGCAIVSEILICQNQKASTK